MTIIKLDKEDLINKLETLVGQSEYLFSRLDPISQATLDYMKGVNDEANEWIEELKKDTPNTEREVE